MLSENLNHSTNFEVLDGPQLSCNATKCMFGTLYIYIKSITIEQTTVDPIKGSHGVILLLI